MEYFNNRTEIVKAFEKLWDSEYKIVGEDLKLFYQNSLRSEEFKDLVYSSQLLEFSNYFGRDFFNDISLVMSSYQNIGTYEALINVIKGIFGEQVIVEFSGDNMQDINVYSSASVEFPIDDTEDNPVVDVDNNRIVAIDNRLNLEFSKIEEAIRLFLPVGIKRNINIGNMITYMEKNNGK